MSDTGIEIAIIGLAGRFPGANDPEEFWRNIAEGRDSITRFTDEQLLREGVTRDEFDDIHYVRAAGVLGNIKNFDADFFGFTPREAQLMDPQIRLFMECAWEAIEDAGYDSSTYSGRIGVFGGSSRNAYYQDNIRPEPNTLDAASKYQLHLLNAPDFLTTQVSFKLNLTGPSITIQTACSTSLVAVHMACQSLLGGECDIALAGGSSIRLPHGVGYTYVPGLILSPDGYCRAFDRKANGTVGGSGVGVVALKRLNDAVADGDVIHAVIKGTAVNNDGGNRLNFSAPRTDGQAEVILAAQSVASVTADSIRYVEAHGTGTSIGDPIEFAGLVRAFRSTTDRRQYCALGSVKTNIGHLDATAGIAGLMKAVFAIKNGKIPPTLHFNSPNESIDLANSPFYISTELTEWPSDVTLRRAGVSSFGMGGTNVHLILEQAPEKLWSSPGRSYAILPISAKTTSALISVRKHLVDWIEADSGRTPLADVGYTLQTGRSSFARRSALIGKIGDDASQSVSLQDADQGFKRVNETIPRSLVFMFPGQGSQRIDMAKDLFSSEPVFRRTLEHCAILLRPHYSNDLVSLLYPEGGDTSEASNQIMSTENAQLAIFVVEYSVAILLQSWGVEPQAYIGHSLGEYVAATLSGVFKLEDALRLIAERGRLMQSCPPGKMLAVALTEEETAQRLGSRLSLAACNANESCVVSGDEDEIIKLSDELRREHILSSVLQTSHAFHSGMMEPVVGRLHRLISEVELLQPKCRIMSTLTGKWMTDEEAVSPEYWCRQLLEPVRFHQGVQTLLDDGYNAFLEVGPGEALSALLRLRSTARDDVLVQPTLGRGDGRTSDVVRFLRAVGNCWTAGVKVNWSSLYRDEKRNRVNLPTYPFERKEAWLFAGGTKVEGGRQRRTTINTSILEDHRSISTEGLAASVKTDYEDKIVQERSKTTVGALTAIKGVWDEQFGFDVGVDDNFYDLGGTSLLAASIIGRLRGLINVEIPLRTFFEHPSVSSLTEEVARLRGDKEVSPPDIARIPDGNPVQLSFAQERLWLLDQVDPLGPTYNIPMIITLGGDVNLEAVQGALLEIVERHEPLRTVFLMSGEQPTQVVMPCISIDLIVEDLRDLPLSEKCSTMGAQQRDFAALPFDLKADLMLRAKLFRVDADESVLLLVVHHIASDAWSMKIISKEFEEVYRALTQGRAPYLPPLPIRYSDYSVWQRSWLQDDRQIKQLRYWQQKLLDAPTLDLPYDRRRPDSPLHRGAGYSFNLPASISEGLRSLAGAENSTMYMALLAAFKVTLSRSTGQFDVVVGAPVSGRIQPSTTGLVGFFLNTLVLRTDLRGNPTFCEVLRRVKDTVLDAHTHQDVPFEKIVEVLNPVRDVNRSPLFQVMVVSLDFDSITALNLADGSSHYPSEENRALLDSYAKYDLTIYFRERGGEIGCNVVYNCDLFESATIEVICRNFTELVAQIVAAPTKPVFDIELQECIEDDKSAIVAENSSTVIADVMEVVQRIPNFVAAYDDIGSMTYFELNRTSNNWGARASLLGVVRGDRVVVFAERSLSILPIIVGLMKIGAVPVLLDASQDNERLLTCALLVKPSATVASGPQSLRITSLLSETAGIPNLGVSPEDSNELITHPPLHGQDPAYIVFTSGSTGRPKPVLTSHSALARAIHWQVQHFDISAGARFSLLSGLDHDPIFRDIFVPLCTGGTLAIPDEVTRRSDELGNWMLRNKVEVSHLTPSLVELIVMSRCTFPDLRLCFIGADRMRPSEVALFESICPGAKLYSVYGATETPQFVAYADLACAKGVRPLVGWPSSDVTLQVVSEHGVRCANGEIGELFVSGRIAEGYFGDKQATDDKFRSSLAFDGARAYRTGDLARRRADGQIEFLGRKDRQVNIRGFRVEVAEIENALVKHPMVAQSVVEYVQDDYFATARLIAYVVPRAEFFPSETELREHLTRLLPSHMVPEVFILVGRIPLRPSGKVDYEALRHLEAPHNQAIVTAYNSITEDLLRGIWSTVLNRSDLDRSTNFFDLGGHSLQAVRIINRISDTFGVRISVRELIQLPTIELLGRQIDILVARKDGGGQPIALTRQADSGRLSFEQDRLWFLNQLEPASSTYNMPITFRLTGMVDLTALSASIKALTERHEELRVRFEMIEGCGRKTISEAVPAELTVTDIGTPESGDGNPLGDWLNFEWSRPFHLRSEAPFRSALARLRADDYVLVITVHHIVSDGWSQKILVSELQSIYNSLVGQSETKLVELPFRYSDYAAWSQNCLAANLDRLQHYWRHYLEGAPETVELPFDHLPSRESGSGGSSYRFPIDAHLTRSINELARMVGVTPFMIFMGAFKVLLYRYTGQADLVVGAHFANRPFTQLEHVVGFFANTLPLRTLMSDDLQVSDVLKSVRTSLLGAHAHQELPFIKLVQLMNPKRRSTRSPIIQVLLSMQGDRPQDVRFAGVDAQYIISETSSAPYELSMVFQQLEDSYLCSLSYRTALFKRETIVNLTENFLDVLRYFLLSPSGTLGDIALKR